MVALKVDLMVGLRWLKRHWVWLNMLEGRLSLDSSWYVLFPFVRGDCVVPIVPAIRHLNSIFWL